MDEIHLASVGLSSLCSLSEIPCLEFMRRTRSTPHHTAAGPQTRTRNRVQLSFVIFPTCSFALGTSRFSQQQLGDANNSLQAPVPAPAGG